MKTSIHSLMYLLTCTMAEVSGSEILTMTACQTSISLAMKSRINYISMREILSSKTSPSQPGSRETANGAMASQWWMLTRMVCLTYTSVRAAGRIVRNKEGTFYLSIREI